jgi:hypothetical protein
MGTHQSTYREHTEFEPGLHAATTGWANTFLPSAQLHPLSIIFLFHFSPVANTSSCVLHTCVCTTSTCVPIISRTSIQVDA